MLFLKFMPKVYEQFYDQCLCLQIRKAVLIIFVLCWQDTWALRTGYCHQIQLGPIITWLGHEIMLYTVCLNTLRLRQNECHITDDIMKCIFMIKYILISINISMKFVSNGPINTITALVQMMAWCRPGDKPLCEPMVFSLLMQNGITQPQWVYKFLWLTFSQIVTINTTLLYAIMGHI